MEGAHVSATSKKKPSLNSPPNQEGSSESKPRPQPECLRDKLDFWKEFSDNKFVLSVIRDG